MAVPGSLCCTRRTGSPAASAWTIINGRCIAGFRVCEQGPGDLFYARFHFPGGAKSMDVHFTDQGPMLLSLLGSASSVGRMGTVRPSQAGSGARAWKWPVTGLATDAVTSPLVPGLRHPLLGCFIDGLFVPYSQDRVWYLFLDTPQ